MEYVTDPVVAVGVTMTVPFVVTDPDQLPSVEDAVTVVAFVVAIVQFTGLPSTTLVGVHSSDAVGAGALTLTVTLWLLLPPLFAAVMVYVAFPTAGGVTEKFVSVQAVLVVIPGPETDAVVPVSQFQFRRMLCPNVIVPGVAVIVGAGGRDVVTVTLALPDFVESSVEVAVMVAVPVPDGVKTPAEVIVPPVAVHATTLL